MTPEHRATVRLIRDMNSETVRIGREIMRRVAHRLDTIEALKRLGDRPIIPGDAG